MDFTNEKNVIITLIVICVVIAIIFACARDYGKDYSTPTPPDAYLEHPESSIF